MCQAFIGAKDVSMALMVSNKYLIISEEDRNQCSSEGGNIIIFLLNVHYKQ
jgi:hypothetical protein